MFVTLLIAGRVLRALLILVLVSTVYIGVNLLADLGSIHLNPRL
jgi:hypothetical protein